MDTRGVNILTSAQWDVLDGLVKQNGLQGTRDVLGRMAYVVKELLDENCNEDPPLTLGDPDHCLGNQEEMCPECEHEPQCFPQHF